MQHVCLHPGILRPATCLLAVRREQATVSPILRNKHLTAEEKPHGVYSAEAPLALLVQIAIRDLLAEDLRTQCGNDV